MRTETFQWIQSLIPPIRARRWFVAIGALAVFLAVDLVTPYFFGASIYGPTWPTFVALGICIAQLNLIAAWAAMAPGNVVLRLPWCLLLTLFMWYALVQGNRFFDPPFSLPLALMLGLILFLGVIVAQIPLWIASRLFGWRLAAWNEAAPVSEGGFQFQIKHLLLGMLILSIGLAPARMVLPAPGLDRSPDLFSDGTLWVLLATVAVLNLLITAPCVWGAFLEKKLLLVLAFAWLLYCALLTTVEFFFLNALLGQAPSEAGLYMFCLNASQCAAVLLTLLAFRLIGFQLIRLRGEATVTSLTADAAVNPATVEETTDSPGPSPPLDSVDEELNSSRD